MHDLLFANRDVWAGSNDPDLAFAKLAARLGLDANRFKEATQSPELRQHIMNDIEAGKAANVQATPTFFLNGRRLTSYPSTLEEFVALIDKQLQAGN